MKTLAAGKGTGILKSLALVLAISMVCTFFTGCGSRQDYASAVTLTAPSAVKTYDGSPLLPGEVEVSGLPEGYTVEAAVTGSQTDAGSSTSAVEQYVITNAKGKDRTKKFKDVTLVEGTLTVEPAEVTIATAGASKAYDASPLTASEVELTGIVESDVVVTATGSQLNVGSSENGYEINWGSARSENYVITEILGTLTVEPAQVTITTASGTKTYDGTELTGSAEISGVLEEGVTVTATGSQLNVGSSENGYEIDWGEANPENYEISEELGTLTVEPAQVNITTGSDTGAYNGTGLEAGVEVSGIVENDVTVTATGSQLNVGSSENGYEIDWGSADPNNYEISEQLGTLTVEPAQVSITTGSETGVYSGTGLSAGVEVSGIVENDVTVTATGSQLNVGSSENGYEIDWGSADPANYVITENLGTLTVEPAQVTITTASASKPYDGTELTAGVEVSGILEDGVTVSATGSQLNVGSSENGYEIDWGSADPANYEITTALGTLTVEPAPVLIRTGSAWKTYDAEVLTSDYVSVTGVVEDGVAVTATGSLLNAGSCVNTYEIDWGNADPANYTVTEELGSLTIDPCPLTIVTHSATKRFDGTPLTCRKTSIICPIETDIWAGGTGAQLYVGSCYNSVAYDWGTQDPNNFDLHVIYGQLIVTP